MHINTENQLKRYSLTVRPVYIVLKNNKFHL